MSGNIPISKAEIEACQEAVQNFRVHELHQLVVTFKYPKLGKKQELVSRSLSILSNPKFQVSAVQKVREIQAASRVRENSQPYTVPTNASASGSSSNLATSNGIANNTMHNQQHNPYNLNPAVNMQQQGTNAFSFGAYMNAYAANYGAAYANHFQASHNFGHPPMPQLNQQHVMPVHSSTSGGSLVKNLRTVELPFFDMMKVIVPMTELPSYSAPTRPGEGRYTCSFGLAPEDIQKLSNYTDDKPLPRYEVQMRVFQLETAEEQQDAFPPGSLVRIDDYVVNLPPVIPTNKPNAEQKRYPRPVNITPYLKPPRSKERPHRLHFEWNGDKRAWAFTVLLVYRLNSDILLQRMRKNPKATRPFERTKETIVRRLNGSEEDDVQMDSLKISLIDPLSRIRIKIPSRAVDCTHLQSFDLNSYLMMNEKRPGWKCPVCDKNAIYSKLIIDEYFERMLNTVASSVDEVELLRDGTWRLPTVDNMVSLDSEEEGEITAGGAADEMDDSDIMIVEKPAKGEQRKKAEPAPVVQQQQLQQPKQQSFEETLATPPPKAPPQLQKAPGTSAPMTTAATTAAVARPTAAVVAQKEKEKQKEADTDMDIICLSSDDEDDQLATAIAASCRAHSQAGTPTSSVSGSGTGPSNNQQQIRNAAVATAAAAPVTGNLGGATTQQNGHNTSTNNNGLAAPACAILQTNGQQPTIFRPIIDDLAKHQIAQNLAHFLQNVYTKNHRNTNNTANSTTSNNNHLHPPVLPSNSSSNH